jgi:hypothetical protein
VLFPSAYFVDAPSISLFLLGEFRFELY